MRDFKNSHLFSVIPSNQEVEKEARWGPERLSHSIRPWSVVVKSPDQEGESLGPGLTQSPILASSLSIYAW